MAKFTFTLTIDSPTDEASMPLKHPGLGASAFEIEAGRNWERWGLEGIDDSNWIALSPRRTFTPVFWVLACSGTGANNNPLEWSLGGSQKGTINQGQYSLIPFGEELRVKASDGTTNFDVLVVGNET